MKDQKEVHPPEYSAVGMVSIVAMFSHPEPAPHSVVRRMAAEIANEDHQTGNQGSDMLPSLWRLVNSFFLINYCHQHLCAELQQSPADTHLIGVIFGLHRWALVRRSAQDMAVRANGRLKPFQQLLSVVQQEEAAHIAQQAPLSSEANSLKLLKNEGKAFQSMNQQFSRILGCRGEELVAISSTEATRLFEAILNVLYKSIDEYDILLVGKVRKERLKLLILYLKCTIELGDSKIGRQSEVSRLSAILREEGYEVLERYFDDLILNTIELDKQHCRRLFGGDTETVAERNLSSEESSERPNTSREQPAYKINIRVFQPK